VTAMDPADWITEFAARLDVPAPDAGTVETLLALAGVAAHSSERTAAPIACYLVGLAAADPVRALDLARAVTAS
jgi:Domain of unknown function (DUF6457)